ncbi:hypothetical protein [Microlunatus parietis]|uniref:Membrane protein implicated in regulation of membrane protease activity n=1 Tax=Microlunatus parietis TaxID=682979 RepID=A0A7Y9IDA2_9ACTN|nr:hypothetical protein [Microlunatus parietis]NYE74679.1 membrane protein implicated in regulation of membrane protease activity [Microlunatus parietis]
MTGREASNTRHQTVGPVDLPYRGFIVGTIAAMVGLVPTLFLWIIVGPVAVVLLTLIVAISVWLFHGATRRGLQVRNYQMLVNRRNSIMNQFMLGPVVVKVPHDDWALLKRGSVANPSKKVRPDELPLKPVSTVARVTSLFD